MSDNKMLAAYKYLLEKAKQSMISNEMKSWDLLGRAVHSIEEKGSVLEELTREQLDQVRNDVQVDIGLVAEYLEDFNQGVEEYIDMELPVLENFLEEKAMSLSDPTAITVLRLRMQAAMADQEHKH